MRRTGVNVVKRSKKPWSGEISVDVRAFWPPGTPQEEVLAILSVAVTAAGDKIRSKT